MGLAIDFLGGGDDDYRTKGPLLSFEDARGGTEVVEPPVRAGADHGLIDGDAACGADGFTLKEGGEKQPGARRGHVNFQDLAIAGVAVAVVEFIGPLGPALNVVFGDPVGAMIPFLPRPRSPCWPW